MTSIAFSHSSHGEILAYLSSRSRSLPPPPVLSALTVSYFLSPSRVFQSLFLFCPFQIKIQRCVLGLIAAVIWPKQLPGTKRVPLPSSLLCYLPSLFLFLLPLFPPLVSPLCPRCKAGSLSTGWCLFACFSYCASPVLRTASPYKGYIHTHALYFVLNSTNDR